MFESILGIEILRCIVKEEKLYVAFEGRKKRRVEEEDRKEIKLGRRFNPGIKKLWSDQLSGTIARAHTRTHTAGRPEKS